MEAKIFHYVDNEPLLIRAPNQVFLWVSSLICLVTNANLFFDRICVELEIGYVGFLLGVDKAQCKLSDSGFIDISKCRVTNASYYDKVFDELGVVGFQIEERVRPCLDIGEPSSQHPRGD